MPGSRLFVFFLQSAGGVRQQYARGGWLSAAVSKSAAFAEIFQDYRENEGLSEIFDVGTDVRFFTSNGGIFA